MLRDRLEAHVLTRRLVSNWRRLQGRVSRGTVQVLAGIHISVEDGQLRLAATDMEVSLRTTSRVKSRATARSCSREGCWSISRDCSLTRPSSLEHQAGEGTAQIVSGSYSIACEHLRRRGLPAAADPSTRAARDRGGVAPGDDRKVSRSASRDESRPVLTGILVRFESDQLVMAATDSYRLSVKETTIQRAGRARGDHPRASAPELVPARRLAAAEGRARRAREPRHLRCRRHRG